MRMYRELTPWYRLLDPPAAHAAEAAVYQAALERAAHKPETLLELGAGAGHNALHMKGRFRCTLTDLSENMLALSRELNPECEHIAGDMRTLRVGHTFDVVLVHDAICYMTTQGDLVAAFRTAYEHTRPGGAALIAPDVFRETFEEDTEVMSGDDGARGLRGIALVHDPDPNDTSYTVDYAFLLRDGVTVEPAHDRHVEGLFPKATWLRLLASVGFRVEIVPRPVGDAGAFDEVFLCRRIP
jgi:trans-aconitate methyltransferase